MNQLSVWKNCLILRWDKQIPSTAPEGSIHSPEDVKFFWPHIKNYCRYNQKIHGFLLSFSKQNLQRLREQFGDNIQVVDNKSRIAIEELKRRNRALIDLRSATMGVKGCVAGELPSLESLGITKYKPRGEFQHRGVSFLLTSPSAPLFASCGLGKTGMVLVSTEVQIRQGLVERGKTLICGKLMTLETGWLDDAKKFTDLKIGLLWEKQSPKRKEKILATLAGDYDAFLVNHEGVLGFEAELAAKKFQKVCLDESTVLKNFHGMGGQLSGGKIGQSLMRIAESAKYRVIMTGTPAPNGIEDLYGQFYFLYPDGLVLEGSLSDFRHTYMNEIFFGKPRSDGSYAFNCPKKWVAPKSSIPKIAELINPLSYRLQLRDCLPDLPPKTVVVRKVEMGSEQRRHYEEMKTALSTIIDDNLIATSTKLAQIAKLRQVCDGFIIDAQEKPHALESNPKVEALDVLLEEEIDRKDKVVIFCEYQFEIRLLLERYKVRGIVSVFGGNSAQQNMENVKRFINDESVRIAVLHPKSAAHGVTFTVAHYVVFFAISYSAEDNYQATHRVERMGQNFPIFVYYLLAKDSIDEVIFGVLKKKIYEQAQLIDGSGDEQKILAAFTNKG